jgi:O-antigen/teichoic acid export membrane protein
MSLSSTDGLENLTIVPLALDAAVPVRFSNKKAYAQTFAATVAIRIFGAASGILAARLLGATGRGELAIIGFLPIMLLSLGEFEFSRSVVVESSKCGKVSADLVATAFWVAFFLGCVEMALLAVVLRFFLPADKQYLLSAARWFTLYLPATYVTAALLGIDQGRGRFGRFGLFQVVPGVVYVLIILCVLWPARQISPKTFAFAMLAAVVIATLLRAGLDRSRILQTRPSWPLAVRMIRRGFSFYVPALAGLALLRADMFLLVRLAPAAAIGAYAVAQAISMGQVGMVNPFVQVGFAAVAGEIEHERALETLGRHFRFAQVAVLGAAVVAAALTSFCIRVLFGPEFLGATMATYFLIGASALWGMEQVLEQGLRAAAHPALGIMSNLLGLVCLLMLAIPGYTHFGIGGLAAGVLLGQLVNLAALIAFCVVALDMRLTLFWAFSATTFHEWKVASGYLGRLLGRISARS